MKMKNDILKDFTKMFQCYYEIYIFVNDLIQFHWFILNVNSYYKLPLQPGVLSIFMYIRLFIEIFKRGACQYWIAEMKKILIIFFIARNSLKIFKKDIPQRKNQLNELDLNVFLLETDF